MSSTVRLAHILTSPMSLLFLRGQLEYMRGEGFDVHLFVGPGDSPVAWPAWLRRHEIPIRREIAPVSDLKALATLFLELRRLRPAIVHCQTPKAGLLGVLAGRLARVPVCIYHVRGLRYQSESGMKRALLKTMERLACRLATRVQSHGASLQREIIAERLCSAGKIDLLARGSNGVDLDHFSETAVSSADADALKRNLRIASGAPVVLFVGRLHRDKGIGDLLDAWERVRHEPRGARLVLVGPDELDEAGHRNLISDRNRDVVVVGEARDPRPYYAIADLVVLPTHREGMPNVLLEAAAMRRCVVATRTTGCVDVVVDGETGTLVEPSAPAELARAILAYLDRADLRSCHAEKARRFVAEHFDQQALWERQAAQYRRLLADEGVA